MSPAKPQGGLVLLDACCLINLFATGRAEQILRASRYEFAVARYVAEEEVLEIEDEASRGRKHLAPSIERLVEIGLLEKLQLSAGAEERELIRFAAQLDDGEAHTLALAVTRSALVATDDKKAIRVFQGHDRCVRTSELVFEWADREKISDSELATLVRAIASRASFFPPRSDPHFERWMALLDWAQG